jgi:hypothetical protein
MGRSYRDADFSDRDEQLNGDFFFEADAVPMMEDTPFSQMELPGEAPSEQFISAKFDDEGFVREINDDAPAKKAASVTSATWDKKHKPGSEEREVPLADARELFFRHEPAIELDDEFGSKRYDQDSPRWLKAFYECVGLARGLRRTEVSRIMLLRYERRGSAGIMVSSLPTNLEASIDVELAARAALSDLPALHKLFVDCYLDGTIPEDRLSVEHRSTITERVGRKLIQRGIYPCGRYFSQRVSVEAIRKEVEKMEAAERRELHNETQRKRRAAVRESPALKQKRTITTLKAAA